MKRKVLIIIGLMIAMIYSCNQDKKRQIAVITGGHDYDSVNFFQAFESFYDLQFDHLIQPEANQIYSSDSIDKYDALVFYDLFQDITEDQKSAFTQMLKNGKGIVFLHHSIASYQDWDEFMNILGARYFLEPTMEGGDTIPASTYLDHQEVHVKVLDPDHKVCRGIESFIMTEEVYDLCRITPEVHPLMGTDHPESMDQVVWTNTYGKSRIVYIQFGHDNNAYSNPSFRKLLRQSISWVSK